MTAYRAVSFHTRLRGVDGTAATILVSFVFAALVLLAAASSA
jgi:hypothetical protein